VVYACEGANRQPEAPPSAIASTFSCDIAYAVFRLAGTAFLRGADGE
jgi:hypothetical protein